jgi:hypothetical protein
MRVFVCVLGLLATCLAVYFHGAGYRGGEPGLMGLVGRPVLGDRLLSCLLPGMGLGIGDNA